MSVGEEFQDIAAELIFEFGSLVNWQRDTLTPNPAAGTVTVTASVTHSIVAAFARPSDRKYLPQEIATTAEHVLVVPAKGLPFAVVAPATHPEVSFDDRVWWEGGRTFRVALVKSYPGPGGDAPPVPVAYLVALVA